MEQVKVIHYKEPDESRSFHEASQKALCAEYAEELPYARSKPKNYVWHGESLRVALRMEQAEERNRRLRR